jgi:hypothetical protein
VSRLRPELLQWYGLFGAALAWAGGHVVNVGVGLANCTAASRHWGIDSVTWTIVVTVVGLSLALLAEAAAISVLLETRSADYDDSPPDGRRHFFALAAALGNILFIVAIVLSAVGALAFTDCRQA